MDSFVFSACLDRVYVCKQLWCVHVCMYSWLYACMLCVSNYVCKLFNRFIRTFNKFSGLPRLLVVLTVRLLSACTQRLLVLNLSLGDRWHSFFCSNFVSLQEFQEGRGLSNLLLQLCMVLLSACIQSPSWFGNVCWNLSSSWAWLLMAFWREWARQYKLWWAAAQGSHGIFRCKPTLAA